MGRNATETVVFRIYTASDKRQILLPDTDSAPPAKIGNKALEGENFPLHQAACCVASWNVIFPGVNFALRIFPNNCAAKLVGCFYLFILFLFTYFCASTSLHPFSNKQTTTTKLCLWPLPTEHTERVQINSCKWLSKVVCALGNNENQQESFWLLVFGSASRPALVVIGRW